MPHCAQWMKIDVLPLQLKRNRVRQTLTRSWVWSFATMTNYPHSSHLRSQTFWLLLRHLVSLCLNPVYPIRWGFLECHDAVIEKRESNKDHIKNAKNARDLWNVVQTIENLFYVRNSRWKKCFTQNFFILLVFPSRFAFVRKSRVEWALVKKRESFSRSCIKKETMRCTYSSLSL